MSKRERAVEAVQDAAPEARLSADEARERASRRHPSRWVLAADDLLTADELADLLGVSVERARQCMATDVVPWRWDEASQCMVVPVDQLWWRLLGTDWLPLRRSLAVVLPPRAGDMAGCLRRDGGGHVYCPGSCVVDF